MWGVEGRRSRYQNQLVVPKISVSVWVAKTVTLGFVIVNKATSSELSWISMNTGVIPYRCLLKIEVCKNCSMTSMFVNDLHSRAALYCDKVPCCYQRKLRRLCCSSTLCKTFITRLQCVFQLRNPVILMSIQSSVRFRNLLHSMVIRVERFVQKLSLWALPFNGVV